MSCAKNKKIGIMTFFKEQNYGAALQAYALMETISDMGYESEFLNYTETIKKNPGPKKTSYLGILKSIGFDINKFFRARTAFQKVPGKFEEFRKNYFNIGKDALYDIEDLENVEEKYHGIVAGSDMVWTDIGQNLAAYYLQFTDYEKRISFSPSLTGCSNLTEDEIKLHTEYIRGIKHLSFREQEGVTFALENAKMPARLTCDPTLLYDKNAWIKKFDLKGAVEQNYILFYMFEGVTAEIRKQAEKIAKEKNLKIRYIPITVAEYDAELKNGFSGAYGPKEFVEMFLNASFVITNSFHGLMFSLIFEKPFLVIRRSKGNKWKANEGRMENILNLTDCHKRYVDNKHKIVEEELFLDYSEIRKKLESFRAESKEYLMNALNATSETPEKEKNKQKIPNVAYVGVKKCSGCSLCAQICPKKCIKMECNDEGFRYPVVNDGECSECGLCVSNCPAMNDIDGNNPVKTLLGFGNDEKLIARSASGGIFATLAKSVIVEKNGVVFGATLDENLKCRHIYVETEDELQKLQNSKYVQSDIGDSYISAKKFLEEGRFVLFCGTPCQIAGLKKYLKKEYSNLITVDLVCHGVPSQKFLDKDIEQYRKKYKFDYVTFRSKSDGQNTRSAYRLSLKKEDRCILAKNSYQDTYYNAFSKCSSYRESCYYCSFADNKRVGDITIGDCDSWREYPMFHPEKAKSIILLNTKNGSDFFESQYKNFVLSELCYEKECLVNSPLSHPSERPAIRGSIYKDLAELTWKEFDEKYSMKADAFKKALIKIYSIIKK